MDPRQLEVVWRREEDDLDDLEDDLEGRLQCPKHCQAFDEASTSTCCSPNNRKSNNESDSTTANECELSKLKRVEAINFIQFV